MYRFVLVGNAFTISYTGTSRRDEKRHFQQRIKAYVKIIANRVHCTSHGTFTPHELHTINSTGYTYKTRDLQMNVYFRNTLRFDNIALHVNLQLLLWKSRIY